MLLSRQNSLYIKNMIRLFTNILIAFFVATSAIVSSASALEVKNSCCYSERVATIIQNDCACCAPVPNHKLPDKAIQIQIKSANTDLQTANLFILSQPIRARSPSLADTRKPLHLASNKLYLKKRALLI